MLVAYPFVMAIYLSMTSRSFSGPASFIWFANYWELLQDDLFRQTVRNSFVFTGVSVAVKTVLGLVLAVALNRTLRLHRMIRGAVLLPWVVPTALSTLGWWWMFDSLYSVINWVLVHGGFVDKGYQWLGTPHLAMAAVIAVNIWRGLPFFAILTLAGLVAIPKELYEAAEVDGAGPLARFFLVTLPLLRPVLLVVILFSTIFTFSDFNIVYVLTRGGPMNSTHLFATLAHNIGLAGGKLGEGAAISLFMFPLLALFVFFQLRMIQREQSL